MRCSAVLSIVLLVIACEGSPPRAYDGEARPRSEVARITASDKGRRNPYPKAIRYESLIVSIDGVGRKAAARQLDVLPGKREVVVWWRRYEGDPKGVMGYGQWLKREEGRRTFTIDAKAGSSYWIKITDLPPVGPPPMVVSER